jgi:hypothetical protein
VADVLTHHHHRGVALQLLRAHKRVSARRAVGGARAGAAREQQGLRA